MRKDKTHIGIIGLGIMGTALSRCLINAGYIVFGYDIEREKMRNISSSGVSCKTSPKNLASVSEVLLLCVTNTTAVEDVVFGLNGIVMSSNRPKIIIDHSTTDFVKTLSPYVVG